MYLCYMSPINDIIISVVVFSIFTQTVLIMYPSLNNCKIKDQRLINLCAYTERCRTLTNTLHCIECVFMVAGRVHHLHKACSKKKSTRGKKNLYNFDLDRNYIFFCLRVDFLGVSELTFFSVFESLILFTCRFVYQLTTGIYLPKLVSP